MVLSILNKKEGTSTILILFLLLLISLMSVVLLQQSYFMQKNIKKNNQEIAYFSAYSGAIYVSTLDYANLKNETDINKKYYLDNDKLQYFTLFYDQEISEVIIEGYYKNEKYALGYDISESVFTYKAVNSDGELVEGTTQKQSVSEIVNEMEDKGYIDYVIEILINILFNLFNR